MCRRLLLVASLTLAASINSSCTLAKPIVCAVTGPIYVLAGPGVGGGGCACDPRALACVFLALSAVGAVSGLVTGILSDINVLCGVATEPCRNWYDPFATNTCGGTFR